MDGQTTRENAENRDNYPHHYQCSFEPISGPIYPGGMPRQSPPSTGDSTPIGTPAETLPPHLQFLEKVHGYTAPPSTWRLSQLAAMLDSHTGPGGGTTPPSERAHHLVELAAHIWDA